MTAWSGVLRGAPWASSTLRGGLADPKRADLAASAMRKGDSRLGSFLGDADKARHVAAVDAYATANGGV